MLPVPPTPRPLPYIGGKAAAQPGRSEERLLLLVWMRFRRRGDVCTAGPAGCPVKLAIMDLPRDQNGCLQ